MMIYSQLERQRERKLSFYIGMYNNFDRVKFTDKWMTSTEKQFQKQRLMCCRDTKECDSREQTGLSGEEKGPASGPLAVNPKWLFDL